MKISSGTDAIQREKEIKHGNMVQKLQRIAQFVAVEQ